MAEDTSGRTGSVEEYCIFTGHVQLHDRPLKYISNRNGGKMLLFQDVRDAFYLTEAWLRKRLETLGVPCRLTDKEHTRRLRETGLVGPNTSKVSVFPEKHLDMVLEDMPFPAYMLAAPKAASPSMSEDAATTLKLKRMQALLRSDLVGRDVNCIQAPVLPSVAAAAVGEMRASLSSPTTTASSSSPPHDGEDVTTRTRVVKRPQRLVDYEQHAGEYADLDAATPLPMAKRRRDASHSHSLTSTVTSCNRFPSSSSSPPPPLAAVMAGSATGTPNDGSGLVVKFQRRYSPEYETMQWTVPATMAAVTGGDHCYTQPAIRSAQSSVDVAVASDKSSSTSCGGSAKGTLRGKARAAGAGGSTSKQRMGKSASSLSSVSSQAMPSHANAAALALSASGPCAFSLSAAIPETQSRLVVRGGQLVEAVTFSSFLGKGQVAPADHPVWRWRGGTAVRKEHYALRFTAA